MPDQKKAKKMDEKSHQVLVSGSVKKQQFRPTKNVSNPDDIKKSLHYSNVDGALTSASSSIFSSFLTPFALFLKATSQQIGILIAVENLMQTVSQMPGAKATEYMNRKKVWTIARILSRFVFFIPLVLLPFLGLADSVTWLIIIAGLIFFFIGFSNPAWSSMMGDLVPPEIRGRYFGRRNTYIGIAGIIATVFAGYLAGIIGFSMLFLIASALGILAIPFVLKMHEPPLEKVFHYSHNVAIHPRHWITTMKSNKGLTIFTAYLLLFNFAMTIAAPFYTVYMLRDLSFDYVTFSIIVVLGALARILSYGYWGKFNDLFGSRTIFIICALLGVSIPFFWLFVTEPIGAGIATIIDGLIFSGFDLVAFDYLLDVVPAEKRPQYIANHSFFVGMGVVVGALAGGFMATAAEGATLFVFTGLQLIFLASFFARILILPVLFKIPELAVQHSKVVPVKYVFWKAVAVEPMKGLQHSITFTFRYPHEISKHFHKEITTAKYKVKMKTS